VGDAMKKLLFGTAALAAIVVAGPTNAADIPAPVYKAPPVIAPVAFSWAGCYIGAQVGYAWGRDRDNETFDGVDTLVSPATAANVNGFKAGGNVGCNYQTGAVVFGVEGDAEWAHLTGSTTFSNEEFPPDFYQTNVDFQGSVRGRIGYAFDRVLLYVTGGVAFAHINEHDVSGLTGAFTDTATTRTGWTVGGGLDYAFTNNWIGRVEYRYADFGTFSYTSSLFGATENHKFTENAVRVGVAYKF
jgi:outer membrane immunogenic protein